MRQRFTIADQDDRTITLELGPRQQIEFTLLEGGQIRVIADDALILRPMSSNAFTMEMRR